MGVKEAANMGNKEGNDKGSNLAGMVIVGGDQSNV